MARAQVVLVSLLLLGASRAVAASLQPLGDLPGGSFYSRASAVSADGSVVVGDSDSGGGDFREAFRWTAGGGMVGLGDLAGGDFWSDAIGVSADGSVVVGNTYSSGGQEPFRWTAGGGMVGGLAGGWATGVSVDGSVIVGNRYAASGYIDGFRWTAGGGMVYLSVVCCEVHAWVNAVSGDGSVVVGEFEQPDLGGYTAFRMSAEGMVDLGLLPSGGPSGVSGDGSVVVGTSGSEAFRWTAGEGTVGLGQGYASGVSGNGTVVVGGTSEFGSGYEAFRWTAGDGMQRLWDLLLAQGVDPAAGGWSSLNGATAVSADGNTIVGSGTRNGNTEAFRAFVPNSVAPLPGDFNNDDTVGPEDYDIWKANFGSTTILAADGNGDGTVNTADYTIWRDHLGQSLSTGAASSVHHGGSSTGASPSHAAPEPATAVLFGAGLVAVCGTIFHRSQLRRTRHRANHRHAVRRPGMKARGNDLLLVPSAAVDVDQRRSERGLNSRLGDDSTEEAVEIRREALDIAFTTLNRAMWPLGGSMFRSVWSGLCAGLVTLALQSWCLAAPQYKLLDLGTFGGNSIANDINQSGQIIGISWHMDGRIEGFRTQPNSPINPATDGLGHMGGDPPDSYADAVNDLGQVIGSGWVGFAFHAAFTLSNGLFGPGSDMGGGLNSYGTAINNRGQLVVSGGNGQNEAYIFRTSGLRAIDPATDDLGTLGGTFKNAQGINELGQVVGGGLLRGNQIWHAYRTAPDAPINPNTDDLGGLGGNFSEAIAINNLGQAVGTATLPNGAERAFRTAPGAAINALTDDLGTLGISSNATDINNSGVVVGYSQVSAKDFDWHAFVSFPGEPMADLNALLVNPIPGAVLVKAHGIIDSGKIVGEMLLGDGATRAFLLTPVPEPATAVLFGVGLAAMLGSFFHRSQLGRTRHRSNRRHAVRRPTFEALEDRLTLSYVWDGIYYSVPPPGVVWAPSLPHLADFTSDGIPDQISANYLADRVAVRPGRNDGTFGDPIFSIVHAPSEGASGVADLNSDGQLDAFVVSLYDNGAGTAWGNVLTGAGNGSFFTDFFPVDFVGYTLTIPVAIGTGDLFGTGRTDVVVAGNGEFHDAYYVVLANTPAVEPTLPGDYNGNDTVGPEDYDIWKANFGSTTFPAADGNGDGTVNAGDYTIWRDHLGQSLSTGAASSVHHGGSSTGASPSHAAPEPATAVLFGAGLVAVCGTIFHRSQLQRTGRRANHRHAVRRPNFEPLEDRLTPSFSGPFPLSDTPPGVQWEEYPIAADFTSDGIPDQIDHDWHGVDVRPGLGDGTFGNPIRTHSPYTWAAAGGLMVVDDFNDDGRLDVCTASFLDFESPAFGSVLLGQGNGRFDWFEFYQYGPLVNPRAIGTSGQKDVVIFGEGFDGFVFMVLFNNGDWPSTAPALPGDFNRNGTVDAADYTVWRNTLGSAVTTFSGADGNGSGIVDKADYDVWKSRFGDVLVITPLAAGDSSSTSLADPIAQPRRTTNSVPRESQREIPPPVLDSRTSMLAHRQASHRHALADRLAPATHRRDAALIAWLASHPDTREPQQDVNAVDAPDIEDANHVVSVDQVFALLASR